MHFLHFIIVCILQIITMYYVKRDVFHPFEEHADLS
jgi:hypothetical protein